MHSLRFLAVAALTLGLAAALPIETGNAIIEAVPAVADRSVPIDLDERTVRPIAAWKRDDELDERTEVVLPDGVVVQPGQRVRTARVER